jgi:Tfp pilus assembly protein PilN
MMRGLLSSSLLSRPPGFSRSASSRASPSTGSVRVAKPWLGGFNLLPYRQRNVRLARQRCLREWLAAALAGAAAVLVLAAWQAFEKTRIDAQRASIERSFTQMAVPLAEHARLTRAQDEQRKATALATSLSAPLTRLRTLLDALSFEPGDGVVLRQLRQREHDTELLATSQGHLASAEWLKRLSAIRGVTGVEMSDLHRPVLRAHALADESVSGPIEFGALLRWGEPVSKAVRAAGAAASRPVKSELSGGTQ